jgi:S1-C subfamily serine protease
LKEIDMQLSQQELHEKILYPVVRIRTTKAGGSGTIIYSKPNPQKPEEYQTFIMTCAHVIEDAVTTRKEWDSLLKKKIEKEFTEKVQVEIFDYVYLSKVNSSNAYRADIVAYDHQHDIAVLMLNSPKVCLYSAAIIPQEKIVDVKLFTPAYASGCSLGHDPFCNAGQITYLSEVIENKLYWMTNCSSIFGNSGGAIFLAETGEQVGITARITTLQLGFGMDVMTWMGFAVAPQRIYEFFEQQELKFLYDPSDTFEEAMKRREKKQKEALLGKGEEEQQIITQPIWPK